MDSANTSQRSHFPGVLVPLVTPFHDDGSLALEVLPALVEFMLDAGITGLVAAGTTGEGYTLDMEERRRLLDEVVALAAGRVPVLGGVGGTATREALAQAGAALAAGVQGLMVAAPAYCLPTPSELGAHVRAVLDATNLPTVLYDYPARTGVQFDEGALDLLAADPRIVGIKEASGDLSRIERLRRRYGADLALVSGSDTLAMHYFEQGVDSWIAGFANVLPAEHVAMLAAAQEGDIARGWEVQRKMLPILSEVERERYTQKVRYGLIARGVPVGPPRAPLHALTDVEERVLDDLLVGLGHTVHV